MPGNLASVEDGNRYQELYGWWRVLELLGAAGRVRSVTIEDPSAGYFDDVVIRPVIGTAHPVEYLQVKFHVDLSDAYSSDSLMGENHGLLLRKAWDTWTKLRGEGSLELHLITTWAWSHKDPLANEIRDERLTPGFVTGAVTGKHLAVRTKWKEYLGSPSEEDLQAFFASLRIRAGYSPTGELLRLARERMGFVGLKNEEDDAWRGARIVREWIIARKREISIGDLEAAITAANLRAAPAEPAVSLAVYTVARPAEPAADYVLDWRDLFGGPDDGRGHALLDAGDWNGRIVPELRAMAARIKAEASVRLLRVWGKARLSPWFAVGFVFRQTTGWTLDVEQYGAFWRTDARPSSVGIVTKVEPRDGSPATAAVVVSITGDASADVRRHLDGAGNPAAHLVHVAVASPGRDAVTDAGDLVAIADAVRAGVFSLSPRPDEVQLYYWGPASGAVFIGHALNAVAPRIQLFESEFGRYLPSIVLE